MKKVILGFAALAMLISCNEESIETPKTDDTKYQVDFTLNGVDISVEDMTPKAGLKSMPHEGDEVNLDVVLVAYGVDETGAKTGTLIPYQFKDENFKVGETKKFTTSLTAGAYDIYAIAVKDLSKYEIDYNSMIVKQIWHDPTEDFWIGKSSIVVTANTTGEVTLNQKYSIIQWHIVNRENEHESFKFYTDLISGISYEKLNIVTNKVETIELGNSTNQNFLVQKFFTFPGMGSSENGYWLNQKLVVNLSNGSEATFETKFQEIQPCKVYNLKVDLTNKGGVKLVTTDWDVIDKDVESTK